MKFIADLHVHSKYSRATSPDMCPEGLHRGARIKGISVIGTGDFTHPAYIKELGEKLAPAEDGLFTLKPEYVVDNIPASCVREVRFILTAEISSIYSKGGRTRKIHSIVLMPGMREVIEFNRRLAAIGNIHSDGRPILGLDARALLDIALNVSQSAFVIPAHAWTPHFSVFGSMSGFDSLEECYGDLTPHIHAIETGLSSDPPMNRRLSMLDNVTLVSNSDAHSARNLGREANVLDTTLSYSAITDAITTRSGFLGTIEFFPEEGKYHHDGHRDCKVSMTPSESKAHNLRCPVCGGKLTIGVMHRVDDLADRIEPKAESFRYIIPLAEIIASALRKGVNTKGVNAIYDNLIRELGNEFHILLEAAINDIARAGGPAIGDAVDRMRRGDVTRSAGYDGVFGTIQVIPST